MTFLANLADDGVLVRVAISVLIQTTTVIVLAAMIARATLRRRADARHVLWLGALTWLLISPVVSLGFERSGLRLWSFAAPLPVEPAAFNIGGSPLPVVPASIDPLQDLRPPAIAQIDATAQGASPIVARPSGPVEPRVITEVSKSNWLVRIIASLWMLGVIVGLVRVVLGYRRLASRLGGARPLDHGRFAAIAASVREALQIASLPSIVVAPGVREPIAIGLVAPRIVLPACLAEAVPTEMLRDVVIHECAHVVRRDLWIGLFQRLAAALYWPYPLVPFMNRRLSQAREEVCDDYVLRAGDRCEYARTLLALTEQCRPLGLVDPGLGLLTPGWSLADRVAGILDPGRTIMSRTTLRIKIVLFLALSLAALGVASLRFDRPARAEEPPARADEGPTRPTPPPTSGKGVVAYAVSAVRELSGMNSEGPKETAGVLVEKTPDGERPVVNGFVSAMRPGASGFGLPVQADDQGRFKLMLGPGSWILHAFSKDGVLAVHARVSSGTAGAKVQLSKGGRIVGRVVDTSGRRVAWCPLGATLDDGSDTHRWLSFSTDEVGRFDLRCLPVGSRVALFATHYKTVESNARPTWTRFRVSDSEPIVIPDLVVPPLRD